jgi:hypothetical protein
MVMTATAFQVPTSTEIATRSPLLLDARSIGIRLGAAINQPISSLADLSNVQFAKLRFPKLNYSFDVPVMDLSPGTTPDTKLLKLGIVEEATLEIVLALKQGGIDAEVILENPSPTAHTSFMVTTLTLMLALGGELALELSPNHFSANYRISTPLSLVGEVFPLRKIAYELMVIERAYGTSFPITEPYNFISKDLITFVYQAITQREFVWQFQQKAFRFQATENAKSFLQAAHQPMNRDFPVNQLPLELQSKMLDLGQHWVRIENATITNVEQIAKELEILDGHDFPVFVYAPNGAATYQFLQTPPPPSSFDRQTQEFIDLEGQLVDLFFDSVNRLAAASLSDLTEERKAAITEPFTLDEEAFSD